MDFVVCNRSRTVSSLSPAKVAASCAFQSLPDFPYRHEDGVIEMLGQFQHALLLGKLPDIFQDINHPGSIHDAVPLRRSASRTADIMPGAAADLAKYDTTDLVGKGKPQPLISQEPARTRQKGSRSGIRSGSEARPGRLTGCSTRFD